MELSYDPLKLFVEYLTASGSNMKPCDYQEWDHMNSPTSGVLPVTRSRREDPGLPLMYIIVQNIQEKWQPGFVTLDHFHRCVGAAHSSEWSNLTFHTCIPLLLKLLLFTEPSCCEWTVDSLNANVSFFILVIRLNVCVCVFTKEWSTCQSGASAWACRKQKLWSAARWNGELQCPV